MSAELAIVVRPAEPLAVGDVGDRALLEAAGCEVRPLKGAALAREDFPELYEAIGRRYTPEGIDEELFVLPDLRDRLDRPELPRLGHGS